MTTRYLAHAVLHEDRIFRNSIVHIEDGKVIITPFAGETQSTIFVPGLIAVCAESRITDADRLAMHRMVQNAPLVERAIRRVSGHIKSARLSVHDDDSPILVMLPRK